MSQALDVLMMAISLGMGVHSHKKYIGTQEMPFNPDASHILQFGRNLAVHLVHTGAYIVRSGKCAPEKLIHVQNLLNCQNLCKEI